MNSSLLKLNDFHQHSYKAFILKEFADFCLKAFYLVQVIQVNYNTYYLN